MPINTDPHFVGRAWIMPAEPVVAGQLGTWTITYEVGAYGYDERARLKIAVRFASDWGTPQFTDPRGRNYTTVRLESRSGAVADIAYEPRGQVRPWFKCLVVSVADGSLAPGDRLHVTLGDPSGGGPGSRAQTFRERGCEFRVFVDPFGTELYVPLASSPTLDVVGGGLHRLVAVAPTTIRPGQRFDALVKVEDIWGNPAERFDGEIKLSSSGAPIDGLPAAAPFRRGEVAVARLDGLAIAEPGAETRIVASVGFHRAESNVLRAIGADEPKTWWGDIHGQTRATVGTGTIEEYFTFGRDVALLDVMCHQANDFQVTEEEWQRLRGEIDRFHADGRCVIFVGYEWSGMTPGGGDRNVMFRGDVAALHRSSHAEVDDMTDAATDCFPVTRLFERFRGRDDVLLIPHVGGRYADVVSFHDPALEPVVEIYSDWGRFEWLLEDALRHGYRVGVVANSDGHKGRPGASHPGASTFGAYGGLTCVLADTLTREAIFDAVRARRCYGVSSAQRIHVELLVNGLPMGGEGRLEPGQPVRITGRAVGTGPIERIDVLRGLDVVRTISPYTSTSFETSNRYRIAWAGSRVRGRDRLTRWDGSLELSSGKMLGAMPWAMDNPEKGIVQRTASEISWVSNTTGDDDGIDVRLDAAPEAVLRFRSPVIDVDVTVGDLADGETKTFPAGGVDLRVFMRRLPARDTTAALVIDVTDEPPPRGRCHAYWIRVTQEDGAQAWTSPVYLDA
ncbi:MAG: DUF3604 domain-containing protein [Candidatus Rokuibacteriota bacterium]|nr:MAG: DUF3604 domain-containing protein [Candidatus Rokubacteria bacterium]